jgi:hypothetical protein
MPRAGAPRLLARSLVAVLAGVFAAAAGGSAAAVAAQRLPRVAPGTLLPSARGLVLGVTTKPQLLASWGPATQCASLANSCGWVVGLGKNFFPEPGGVSDSMLVTFDRTTKRASTLSLSSSNWRKSRLAGWKLPGGIGIGSEFAALRRAFPTLHWSSGISTRRDGSRWIVTEYEHGGAVYRLLFSVDAGAPRAASGHVFGVDIVLVPEQARDPG